MDVEDAKLLRSYYCCRGVGSCSIVFFEQINHCLTYKPHNHKEVNFNAHFSEKTHSKLSGTQWMKETICLC